jgi:uncharacterized membrane protein
MNPKEFLDKLDDSRIIAAIATAEQNSSGELRVYVSHKKRHNALEAAQARFQALGMHKTRDRNAVLIYIVPHTHQFAIWGDIAVNEKCGESFWKEVAANMTRLLKQGLLTEAIEQSVKEIGAILARHFPRRPDDSNELPDAVIRD